MPCRHVSSALKPLCRAQFIVTALEGQDEASQKEALITKKYCIPAKDLTGPPRIEYVLKAMLN